MSRSGALLQVWDVATGQPTCELYEPLGVTAVAFDPSSQTVAYGAGDHSLVLQPLPSGQASRWNGHRLSIGDIAFSSDGKWLASFSHDSRILIWDMASAAVIGEAIDEGTRFASQVRFAGPEQLWTRSNNNSSVRWYDFNGKALMFRNEVNLPENFNVITADNSQLYGWQPDHTHQIVDAATGRVLPSPIVERAATDESTLRAVVGVAASSHDLAAHTSDGRLTVWTGGTFDDSETWSLSMSNVNAIAADQMGRKWAVHGADGGLLVFDRDHPDTPQWLEQPTSVSTAPLAAPRFGPNGETMVSMKDAETVLISEIETGLTRRRLSLPRTSDVVDETSVTILLKGRHETVYCGNSAGRIEILKSDAQTTPTVITVGKAAIAAMAESPDQRYLLVGDADGSTHWIDLRVSSVTKSQQNQAGRITAAEFSADGRSASTASGDYTVVLWDVASQSPRHTLRGHEQGVQAISFSRDSQQLVSGDAKGSLIVWNVSTGKHVWIATLHNYLAQPHTSPSSSRQELPPGLPRESEGQLPDDAVNSGITSIALSGDQRVLAVGTATGYTQTFDLEHGTQLSAVFHRLPVSDLMFAEDDASLLVATRLGDVSRWWRAPDKPRLLSGHEGSVRFAALDISGNRAVTGGTDRQLKIWDVEQGSLVRSLDNAGEAITCGTLSADGQRAVTCGYGSGLMFWDLVEMKSLGKRYGHKQRVWSLAFSPDGETVASGSDDRSVKTWVFSTQKTIHTIEHDAPVHFVRFSPDGTKLLTSTIDPRSWQFPGRLQLWDTSTGKPLWEFKGHRITVNSAVFSEKGDELTSCGADGQVCRWNVATGECISDTFRPHGLSHAGLISDGQFLVMRRFNNGVFIDRVDTLARMSEFDAPTRSIGDLNVASQGHRIIAGTEEGAVYIWSLDHE
ncbi:MAG: WD40 repeat domain-containing protein [Planctomycetaceae bacterium]